MQKLKEKQGDLKAVGQFFYGENFNEPAFVVARGMNGFKLDETSFRDTGLQKKVQSVRWLANFTPKQRGVYTFTIKPDSFSHVFIDGENVKNQEVQLEAGREYSFLIAYFGNPMIEQEELLQLDVQYTFNGQKRKEVEVETFSIPEIASFEVLSNEWPFQKVEEEPLLDTDNDGIYDKWEIEGYTVINHVVYPWPDKGSAKEKEYKDKGYKKYVSNPNESHTAGDPYSDLEKASGALDRTINKVAWDPMVAVYPSITVGMEELILSKKAQAEETVGKSVSRTTSSSVSDSNTLGIDANAGWSLFGPSISVTGHYSHTSTHTVDSSDTSGQDWHTQLGINTGDSANLNANVRYYNTGTAPVYKLVPTTNLVLGKETIATVTGQLNQKAVSIAPGETYPKRHLHGLALNTLDQFSSTPISLNINQLDRLEEGEKLKIETDQFQGAFARRDPAGGQVVMEENEWADYMPQIESSTTGILINMDGNRFMERRIAAKDPQNPNDLTPELTLKEALQKSIGAIYDEKEKNWYFVDEETDTKHILSSDLVHFVFDKKTKKLIEVELNKQNERIKDMYKMIIRPGMNIQINVPVLYDDFQESTNSKWEGGTHIDSPEAAFKGKCYKVERGKTAIYGGFSLERESIYQVQIAVKGGKGTEGQISAEVNGLGETTKYKFEISQEYKNQSMLIKTFGDVKEKLEFLITNSVGGDIYIDNFAVVKVGRGIDDLKAENKEYSKDIQSEEAYSITRMNEKEVMSNPSHSLACILNKPRGYGQKFKVLFEKQYNAFKFVDPGNKQVLTWSNDRGVLYFKDDVYDPKQYWYFKKSTTPNQIGYQIISAADRSKVLEAVPFKHKDMPDLVAFINIATLDDSKESQYFRFPQGIE
ncbi:binary toxin-like calcium binding domain-containing protein [Bacillus thuringiensis]|uniref:Peptidase n=1 Tax=Bacillus thuringiensis TaxID=1428 RepID=A0A9X6TIQ0_BACTU|nr:binary toxin-like calcium binding domain-containing protein [Bacillus thuringiensis]PEA86925.1 peptidase [Bacillus thuringiensis]